MINVLVTGGNGQLANNLKDLTKQLLGFKFIYKSSKDLDITNFNQLNSFFKETKIEYCVNCAAYTAVDKAEDEVEGATNINEIGTGLIAKTCAEHKTTLIHISTDFVFDGFKSSAYTEKDATNPLNVYGLSKLKGEQAVNEFCKRHFIIRTSWLYSEYNSNFLKTMITLSKSKKKLNVVDDQIGTPTYAKDLAEVILHIITSKNTLYGLYNYSNEGVASWYDFAYAIFYKINADIELSPIKSKLYHTSAKRPYFSILDKSKIKESFNINIPHWQSSLDKAIANLK